MPKFKRESSQFNVKPSVLLGRLIFLLSSQTVCAILVGRHYTTLDCLRKLSAVPSESVRATVVVENSGSKHRLNDGACPLFAKLADIFVPNYFFEIFQKI